MFRPLAIPRPLLPLLLLALAAMQPAFAQDAKPVTLSGTPISLPPRVTPVLLSTGSGNLMTPELLWSLKRVADPHISPDGKWVLYTMNTPDLEANRGSTDLYIIPSTGGTPRQLTTSPSADFNGCWSPDGGSIAFLSTRDGAPQIYVMSLSGGDARKVTTMSEGVENLAWSPDGKWFSFTSEVKLDATIREQHPDLAKVNARVYDHLPVRHWDTWEDESWSHLFIIPVEGGVARDLMPNERVDTPLKPFGGGEQICWSPDATEIAYTAKKGPRFAESTDSDIFLYSLTTGEIRNITKGMPGFDRDPLYAPDGRRIAFHSMERAGFESDRNRLMLYDRTSGAVSELSKSLDQWVGATVWAPDSKSLYFSAEDSATVQMYRMRASDGTWEILTSGWYNHDGGLGIARDGSFLVYGRRSMNRPTELFRHDLKTKAVRPLTDANGEVFARIQPARIEQRWITSTDGAKVQSWVIYPPDFDPAKRYPLITYCQGGPQSTVSQFFSYAWNFLLYASQGYVVVAPNRRGLPGFGQAWNDAISRDWGGKAMQDILAATDAMLAEPYIDRARASAIGASAGGYAVFWLAGNHNKRFSAFVSHCGVFNLESMYGSTEELWFVNWDVGGPYWDPAVRPGYEKNSPHRFAQNWDTPILIVTGEKDFRIPFTQSLEAFTVAQTRGIPSRLLIYPEENHWVLHPQEQILWFREFFDFLDAHSGKNRK